MVYAIAIVSDIRIHLGMAFVMVFAVIEIPVYGSFEFYYHTQLLQLLQLKFVSLKKVRPIIQFSW